MLNYVVGVAIVLRADAEHALPAARHHGLCAAVHPRRHSSKTILRFGVVGFAGKKTPQLNAGAALPAIDAGRAAFCLPVFFETAARGFSRRHGERNGLIPAAAGKFDFFSVGNCAEINKMI
ncbi:MAG: hypothetical protein ACLR4Z_01050 [Butyricicoccaceae bacterium]